jgi:hypothetical protein
VAGHHQDVAAGRGAPCLCSFARPLALCMASTYGIRGSRPRLTRGVDCPAAKEVSCSFCCGPSAYCSWTQVQQRGGVEDEVIACQTGPFSDCPGCPPWGGGIDAGCCTTCRVALHTSTFCQFQRGEEGSRGANQWPGRRFDAELRATDASPEGFKTWADRRGASRKQAEQARWFAPDADGAIESHMCCRETTPQAIGLTFRYRASLNTGPANRGRSPLGASLTSERDTGRRSMG